MTQEEVVGEISAYILDFIAVPNPVFGGLPVCPFAAKALRDKRIDFQVAPFSGADIAADSDTMNKLRRFQDSDDFDILMFVHPERDGMSIEKLAAIIVIAQNRIGNEVKLFGGHPADDFNIGGVYTRRDPFPNFQAVKTSLLAQAEQKIAGTNYYKNFGAAKP